MLNIASRLVQAKHVTNPVKHVEEESVAAGRVAEDDTEEMLRKVGGVYASDIFRALRIPDEFQTRRHEVDLVVLSAHGIYCLEVKNWSGEVSCCKDPAYWEQKHSTSAHSAKVMQHLSPLQEIKMKCQMLRNHLMRAGVYLGENKFIPKVILVNSNCKLEESISNDPAVVAPDQMTRFVSGFQKSLSTVLTEPFIPYFFCGQLSYGQMSQTRCALSQIGTWDVMELNGGRKLVGDYKGCSEISVNRKDVDVIQFSHQRNATTATVWALLGYVPSATVTLLKRGGSGWFGPETVASVTLPYNRDISFRLAGEVSDAKIPANDISKIVLSR